MSKKARRFIATHVKCNYEKYRMPMKQAIAVAYSEARERGFKVGKLAYSHSKKELKKRLHEVRHRRKSRSHKSHGYYFMGQRIKGIQHLMK